MKSRSQAAPAGPVRPNALRRIAPLGTGARLRPRKVAGPIVRSETLALRRAAAIASIGRSTDNLTREFKAVRIHVVSPGPIGTDQLDILAHHAHSLVRQIEESNTTHSALGLPNPNAISKLAIGVLRLVNACADLGGALSARRVAMLRNRDRASRELLRAADELRKFADIVDSIGRALVLLSSAHEAPRTRSAVSRGLELCAREAPFDR